MTEPNAEAPNELRRSPHIERSIDNTAMAAYMRCPREYLYSMVMHRRRRGLTSPALAYGTCWHAIMEAHYKTGGNSDAVTRAAIMAWEPHDNPDDHRTLERCLNSYDEYVKKYGPHEQETRNYGKTVGFPENPVVEIPTELWWPGALHPYTGKIDRIVEYQGLYYVEDHKTSSQMGATYFRQFDPSNQMMGYAWLAQKLTSLPIAGVRINAHAVLKRESKFERQTVMFSQDRLQEWTQVYNQWILKIEGSAKAYKEAIDAGKTADEAALIAYPHNFNACAGKYGMCGYVDVDTSPIRVRQRILETDYDLSPWDPMSADDGAAE